MANTNNGNGNHDLPFAKELWEACDRLRGSVESAEHKHLVLGPDTYHARRGTTKSKYEDAKGFCASATLEDIEKHGFALTPGRYVSAPGAASFHEKIICTSGKAR